MKTTVVWGIFVRALFVVRFWDEVDLCTDLRNNYVSGPNVYLYKHGVCRRLPACVEKARISPAGTNFLQRCQPPPELEQLQTRPLESASSWFIYITCIWINVLIAPHCVLKNPIRPSALLRYQTIILNYLIFGSPNYVLPFGRYRNIAIGILRQSIFDTWFSHRSWH